jgi:hypothetical protein
MKVTVDAKTKKILEGAILAINGDEVLQSFLAVMLAAIPYTAISREIYLHPTVAEYLPTCSNAQTIGVSVPSAALNHDAESRSTRSSGPDRRAAQLAHEWHQHQGVCSRSIAWD